MQKTRVRCRPEVGEALASARRRVSSTTQRTPTEASLNSQTRRVRAVQPTFSLVPLEFLLALHSLSCPFPYRHVLSLEVLHAPTACVVVLRLELYDATGGQACFSILPLRLSPHCGCCRYAHAPLPIFAFRHATAHLLYGAA